MKQTRAIILASAAILFLLTGCENLKSAVQKLLAKPPQPEQLTVLVEPLHSPEADIKIRFSQDVIIENEEGEPVYPTLTFYPPLKGKAHWENKSTLRFTPEPGQFSWGGKFRITVGAFIPEVGEKYASEETSVTLSLPRYRAGDKVASWDTVTGQPRFVSTLGSLIEADQIGTGPFYLLYDQPVDPEFCKRFIKLGKGGRAVSYTLSNGKNMSGIFGFTIDDNYVLALQLPSSVKDGESLVLEIPSWTNGKEKDPDYTRITLRVNKKFTLDSADISNQLPSGAYEPNVYIHFEFNNTFDMDQFYSRFKIEPRPENIRYMGMWGTSVSLNLDLKIGETYTVSLGHPFKDYLGNDLSENYSEKIRVRDHYPVLQLPQNPILTEAAKVNIPVRLRNINKALLTVYRFNSAPDYIRALRKESADSASDYGLSFNDRESSKEVSFKEYRLNQDFSTDLDLTQYGKPGYHLVEVKGSATGTEGASPVTRTLLYNSCDIGIVAKVFDNGILAWVTGFGDAKPKAGYDVRLYDKNGALLATGVTDQNGLVTLNTIKAKVNGVRETLYLEASKGEQVSLMKVDNGELSSAWQFNLPSYPKDVLPIYGTVFTERGVYRPSETVYIKTLMHPVSSRDPADTDIKVMDPRGKVLLNEKVHLDDFKGADYELILPQNAPVGRYDILISSGGSRITGHFRVEEYRVPTFVVTAKSATRKWQNGEPVTLNIHSEYYNGGTMGSREAAWTVRRSQAPLRIADYPDFIFQAASVVDSVGVYATGSGTLNGDGDLKVSFTPEHPVAAGRLLYTFEAVVTDIDRQAYAGRFSEYIHPAGFYVGVKPPAREVLASGSATDIPVVVVDPEGKTLAGQTVRIEVEQIENHSSARMYEGNNVQLLNHRHGEIVATGSVKSGATPVNWRFVPKQAGIYRVNFTGRDSSGQEVKTYFYTTVTGDESTAWPRFDIEQIEVVKDKPIYRVGDVARITPQTPYKKATVLVTVEKSDILETRIVTIDNNTPAIEIPITAEMNPNVYVSVVLLRGRTHFKKDASGYETGAPGFKIGYTMLSVDPADQRLSIDMSSVPARVTPGQRVTIPVQVKDAGGKGVLSQLTVMVVDEAVLDMTGYVTPNPVADIYTPRPLGVRTGTNWLDLPHSRRERLEKLFPGGGGDDGWGADDSARSDKLRDLFKSTAYWNPTLKTDADGRAEFSFVLPDNLTTYRVMIVSADRSARYGSADREMTSQKPLMVQPVIPRFAYPEDTFSIEALVINNTGKPQNVEVRVEMVGLKLTGGKGTKSIKLDDGKSGTVSFPVQAGISGNATIRFYASAGMEKDTGEFKLPVLSPGTRVSVVESKKLTGNTKVSLPVPQGYIAGTLKAQAVLSKTALTELQDSVQYLMEYPNGCIEQTTSTAYPLVVLDELIPLIGVDVDRAELKEYADAGIKRILSFQTPQGGLSYWPGGSEPHAFATAFGLTALIAARDKGYDIPADALSRMADFLELSLRSGKITGEMPHGSVPDADTRALFVMTLGRLGRPQPQYINALWEKRKELTPFGLSLLAIAVEEMGNNPGLRDEILEEIKRRAEIEPSEAYFEGDRDGGWSMGSPLRSHGGALLAYGITNTDSATGGKFLQGLLDRRVYGLWGNTQENVFGIMGVYEFATGGGGGGATGNEEWNLVLQGKSIDSESLEAPDRSIRRISFTDDELKKMPESMNRVTLKSTDTGGFLSLRLTYELPLSMASFDPVSAGFTLQRTYETMDGKSLEGKDIPVGSLVKVRLRVSTKETRHYVALDDKLPAGLEPLNSNLKTTESVEMGKLSMEAQKGMSVLSYQEIRDSRVAFYVDEMIPGEYEFVYVARATTPGKFLRPAGRVEAMYEPDVSGTTGMNFVKVK